MGVVGKLIVGAVSVGGSDCGSSGSSIVGGGECGRK